jgi:hypothetical protein
MRGAVCLMTSLCGFLYSLPEGYLCSLFASVRIEADASDRVGLDFLNSATRRLNTSWI